MHVVLGLVLANARLHWKLNARGLFALPTELLLEIMSHTASPILNDFAEPPSLQVLGEGHYFTDIIPTPSFSAQCTLAHSMEKEAWTATIADSLHPDKEPLWQKDIAPLETVTIRESSLHHVCYM